MMVTYEDGTKLYSHRQKTKGKENCLALEKNSAGPMKLLGTEQKEFLCKTNMHIN